MSHTYEYTRGVPARNILMCEFLDMFCGTNDVEGRMLLVCGIVINFNIGMNTIEFIYYLEAMFA